MDRIDQLRESVPSVATQLTSFIPLKQLDMILSLYHSALSMLWEWQY